MKSVPLYKAVLDSFIIKKPEDWASFSSDDLYKHLEQINTNSRSISQQKSGAKEYKTDDSVQANAAHVKNNDRSERKPCFSFSRTGACSRTNCRFTHIPDSPLPTSDSVSEAKADNVAGNSMVCQQCGGAHQTQSCNFDGDCGYCGRTGHNELFCLSKKAGKPKALLLNAEGSAVQAHLVVWDHAVPPCVDGGGVHSALQIADGTVCEQFFADTGANCHIHPDTTAASSFCSMDFSIGTVTGPLAMTSDGVGSMELYTPGGSSMPGFDRVVFSKQASVKLASVGTICDQDMVCVFNSTGLRIYRSDDIKIEGQIIAQDARDPRTRLYPLSLRRFNADIAPDVPGQALLAKTCDGLSDLGNQGNTLTTIAGVTMNLGFYKLWGASQVMRLWHWVCNEAVAYFWLCLAVCLGV
jgi:hypothetical protein